MGKFKTHEQFCKEVYDLVGNNYTILGQYKKSSENVLIRHNNENCNNYEWEVNPNNFLRSKSRCPKCAGNARKTTDEFKQEVFKLTNGEYKILGEYVNASTDILLKHEICNKDFPMSPSEFLQGNRCPECNKSKGEKETGQILSVLNLKYISQYKFEDLRGIKGGSLSFDFYLPKYNLLIEFQGEQHEFYIPGMHKSLDDFAQQLEHDKNKKEYARNNKINFLEIWYWQFNRIKDILELKLLELFNNDSYFLVSNSNRKEKLND